MVVNATARARGDNPRSGDNPPPPRTHEASSPPPRTYEASSPPSRTHEANSPPATPAVLWHDLECGSYSADLSLWLELARACPDGAILDVGAGSGRVALELARTGRRVIALDENPELLAALGERAGDLSVETVCADARSFQLPAREQVGLCVVPMQTIQLLGGGAARLAFLRCARAHLRRGALLACALVTDLEPFDRAGGGPRPAPDSTRLGAALYVSQPIRVEIRGQRIAIERERRVLRSGARSPVEQGAHGSVAQGARGPVERDLIELERVGIDELEREGAIAGLRSEPARHIAPTEDHAGSVVVMLRA